MKKATNSASMRQSNRRMILDIIRHQPISRMEIASLTHLTRASVTIIVDELISSGLLRETQAIYGSVGRRPIQLEIVENARCAVGVNIKRGHVDVGLVELGGRLISGERLDYAGRDAGLMLELIAQSAEKQIKEHAVCRDRLLGVGVCAPGPLDYVHGVILTPPNCSVWWNVCVTRPLSEALGLPVLLENVSNALALEEQYFGLGADCENFLAVQINEGIGTGIVIHDHLFRGANGLGSELGHISIQMDGIPCSCGNVGCLEKYASMPALLAGSPFASWRELADHLPHDAEAMRLMKREAHYLGSALVSAINLFDIEKVILLGDVCYRPEPLLGELSARVAPRVIMRSSSDHSVVAGQTESFIRTGAISALHDFYKGEYAADIAD